MCQAAVQGNQTEKQCVESKSNDNERAYYICFVVIDGLDRLKKENAGARDGIRFLESEFRKGNRWVLLMTDGASLCTFFRKGCEI